MRSIDELEKLAKVEDLDEDEDIDDEEPWHQEIRDPDQDGDDD